MKPQDFIDKIAPGAVADMKKTKIPASLTIAQAILESAWGESGLTKQGNNLFGIKGTGPAGVCAMPTKENYNGQWTTITANFRAYNNWGESIADHSKLILNGTRDKPTRYHGVLGVDYRTACHAIHFFLIRQFRVKFLLAKISFYCFINHVNGYSQQYHCYSSCFFISPHLK